MASDPRARSIPDGAASGRLCFVRREGGVGGDEAVGIWIDGLPAGVLSGGHGVELPVAPGIHEVEARQGWAASLPRAVQVRAGERVEIEVAPRLQGFWSWRARVDALFVPETHFAIRVTRRDQSRTLGART